MPDYYEVLGVDSSATHLELESAYRRRAQLLHPDRHVGVAPDVRAESERSMRDLNEAWEVLGNPISRASYDESRGAPGRPAEPHGAGRMPPARRPEPTVVARKPLRRLGKFVEVAFLLLITGGALFLLLRMPGSSSDRSPAALPSDTIRPQPAPVRTTTSTTNPPPTYVIFDAQRGGNWDIYRRDLRSGAETRLTSDPGEDRNPSFRSTPEPPILFESNRNGDFDIYVMNSDGSNQRKLTSDPGDDTRPDWSPNGRQIVFLTARDGQQGLFVMSADGSGQRRLSPKAVTNDPGSAIETDDWPQWTSNLRLNGGNSIVFASVRAGGPEIFVIQPDGTGLVQLTSSPGADYQPQWSADGTKILFTSERDGNSDVYIMNSDGSSQTRLTSDAAADYGAVWVSTGMIVFGSDRTGRAEVYLMNSDGSGVVRAPGYSDQVPLDTNTTRD